MQRTLTTLAFLTIGSAPALFGLVPEPPVYYPLAVGNRWVYVGDRLHPREYEHTVLGLEEGFFVVNSPSPLCASAGGIKLQSRDNAIDIELRGEVLPYYRFDEERWLHHDLCACGGSRVLVVASRNEVVETPAGVFGGCLRLEYEPPPPCFDAGLLTEWWAPGIGRVKWEEETFAGPETFVLTRFELQGGIPAFRRGDINQDTVVDLSDAIATFGFLFLGQPAPLCLDAADSNDDGHVDISDGIRTLTFLFAQGPSLPAPGPSACGGDPTDDTLTCQFYQYCVIP